MTLKCDRIEGESNVQQFYRGAHVFVTGGTGFMGKVLLEKLLWSCPGVDIIYLLLRSKRGKTGQERVDELVNSQCFERLRNRSPGFKAKLVAIQGDIGEEGLGLSDQDRHLLAKHVTIVFHVAATVRFNEALATAIKMNVRATRDLLALCKTCPLIKAVVHTSTAFSNYPLPYIGERFYETRVDCDKVIEMLETLSDDVINSTTKQMLGDSPNTYLLTKALGEQVVRKHGQGLPIAISRPGAVACSATEPACGWSDSFTVGPLGLVAEIAAGSVRVISVDGNAFANIVPCDLAINSVIVAAWEVAEKRSISQEIPIYNYTTPASNGIKWRQYFGNYAQAARMSPSSNALWYPYSLTVKNKQLSAVLRFLLHLLSAYLMDVLLKLQGKRSRMCAMYEKVHFFMDLIGHVVSRPWCQEERNVPALWAMTSKQDREIFPFDMRDLDWDSHISQSFLGIRKFMLKEDEGTILAANIRLRRLFWLHCSTIAGSTLLFCWAVFITLNFITQPIF